MSEKNSIQKLYENSKSRNFVNHLIRSYLPINKISKVWSFKGTQKQRCSVCGVKLFDIETAFSNLQKNDDKLREEFNEVLKKQVNGEEVKIEEHPMYKYVTKGKVQAFTGEKTDTCICAQCSKDLLDLVQNGMLMEDKNLNWIVNKMQRENVFNTFKSSENLNTEEKAEVEKIEKRVERSKDKKVSTFGDLEVLKNLKEKMEKS